MADLTLQQAAAELGMSPETLRWQIRNGKLKASKMGPIWTVTRRELERYRRDSRREKAGDS
jgi:excisionase family DNA binding protein